MPFFLKSREKAVSHSQPGCSRFPCSIALLSKCASTPNISSSFFQSPSLLFNPLQSSQRQGVRLTIASSLSETGGVTHFGLCVLAVSAVSRGSSGGRVRSAYVVTLVSGRLLRRHTQIFAVGIVLISPSGSASLASRALATSG